MSKNIHANVERFRKAQKELEKNLELLHIAGVEWTDLYGAEQELARHLEIAIDGATTQADYLNRMAFARLAANAF